MNDHKIGSFEDFKAFTLAVTNGTRTVDASEPKIWIEAVPGEENIGELKFQSIETGARLLSTANRTLLRVIATRHPRSVSELATLTGRAEQNLMRTLRKLSAAGIIRLDRGAGRAYRPVVLARKVHFEIDLLAG